MTHGSSEISFRLMRLRGSRCSIRVISVPHSGLRCGGNGCIRPALTFWSVWLRLFGCWGSCKTQPRNRNGVHQRNHGAGVSEEEPKARTSCYVVQHPQQTKRIHSRAFHFTSVKLKDQSTEQFSANTADLRLFYGAVQNKWATLLFITAHFA